MNMVEKFSYISADKARRLVHQTAERSYSKNGIDSRVYFIDDYAVLRSGRIKLRNIATYDHDLKHLDDLIRSLMNLHEKGIGVIPILGYCYDADSHDGDGYIIEPVAKGKELYDDAVLHALYVWGYGNDDTYLSSTEDPHQYLLSRIKEISQIPQIHFDKFIQDIIELYKCDILIDFWGRSNFFYDSEAGFQFIDINSHTDFYYGLEKNKRSIDSFAASYGFTPCQYSSDTALLKQIALHDDALSIFTEDEILTIEEYNRTVFLKCKNALLNNGIPLTTINEVLQKLKIFGCR